MAPRLMGVKRTPRSLVLSGHLDAVSDAGLLSLLIGEEGEDGGRRVLDAYPVPDALWKASAEDLTAVPGVGPAAAARVLASLEISRRASVPSRPSISSTGLRMAGMKITVRLAAISRPIPTSTAIRATKL